MIARVSPPHFVDFLLLFSKRLYLARTERGLPMGRIGGIHSASILRYEGHYEDRITEPSALHLSRLALALGVTSDWLVGLTGDSLEPEWKEYSDASYLCRDSMRAQDELRILIANICISIYKGCG